MHFAYLYLSVIEICKTINNTRLKRVLDYVAVFHCSYVPAVFVLCALYM